MWSILKFIVGITKHARGDENPKVEWEFGDLGKTFTLQCTGKYAEKVTPYLNSVKTSSTLGLEDFFSGSIGSLCHCWMIPSRQVLQTLHGSHSHGDSQMRQACYNRKDADVTPGWTSYKFKI
jgi:hypothetical protein